MKFIKKAAALFFCAALALSVMAVGAMADDDAELLDGLAEPVPNSKFEITLVKAATSENTTIATTTLTTNITAEKADYILDRDAEVVNGYEVKAADEVTFKIVLKYHGGENGDLTGKKISGFQFDFDPGTAGNGGNNGVEISGLTILQQNVYELRTAIDNTYAGGSSGLISNDINMPASDSSAVIGTVTFKFDNATQDTALTPTITNMQVFVRNVTNPQLVVKVKDSENNVLTPDSAAYTNLSEHINESGSFYDTRDGNTTTYPSSLFDNATATTDEPIYVNPSYQVTVERFQANKDTGVAELRKLTNLPEKLSDDITTTEATDAQKNAYVRHTFNYYYDKDDTNSADGAKTGANTLPDPDEIIGYTFQGWMVTVNQSGENNTPSATWDAYVNNGDSKDGDWTKETSYPTRVTSVPDDTWATAESVSAWNGQNEASTAVAYKTFNDRHPSSATEASEAGVKFIPADVTTIPAGYVGPITLTPVYTRDVYTVTFNADNFTNNPNSKAFFGSAGVTAQSSTNKARTDYYTIENLVDDSGDNPEAADYLDIAYGSTAPYVTGDNANLQKPGYKFVGWVPSGYGAGNEVGGKTIENAYKWTVSSTKTRVKQVDVIREKQMKRYGNLILTAEWELDIYFAKVEYWFGGAANSLILVAVPATVRTNTQTYTYRYTQAASGDNAAIDEPMFLIPQEHATDTTLRQRVAYMNAAMTEAKTEAIAAKADTKEAYTITEAFFKADDNNAPYHAADSYVLFAYIGSTETLEKDITLTEATSGTSGNTAIAYDGDVDGSNTKTIADFGNVDSLLNDATTTAGIFSITLRAGVEARLEADISTATHTGDDASHKFASIADVKGVYNQMGYNETNT